jgi:hypothetical protein
VVNVEDIEDVEDVAVVAEIADVVDETGGWLPSRPNQRSESASWGRTE